MLGSSSSFAYLHSSSVQGLKFLLSPDRWDALPEKAQELPGLFYNTLTFSAGPRVSFSNAAFISTGPNPFLVLHWNAVFYDRNEDLPIHFTYPFHLHSYRRQNSSS